MLSTTATTITGNLTRDPEIRYTRDGQATTSLGVAVNRRWQNRESKEWEESTSFFDVVCWRELAENTALSLTKGTRVVVTGRLEQRSWETEEGDRRFKVEIVADEVGGQPADSQPPTSTRWSGIDRWPTRTDRAATGRTSTNSTPPTRRSGPTLERVGIRRPRLSQPANEVPCIPLLTSM